MASCPTNRLGSTAIPDKPITENDIKKIEGMYKCTVDRTAYDEWLKEKMAKACAVDSCITTWETEESTKIPWHHIEKSKKCRECVFPFTHEGVTHTACTTIGGTSHPWCSTKTDENGKYLDGHWGYCNMDKCTEELAQACAVDSCITTKISKKPCNNCTFPFTYNGITHTGSKFCSKFKFSKVILTPH